MSTLQGYLTGAFHTDRQDVAAIDDLIIEAARTLVWSFTERAWPYEVRQGTALAAPKKLSHSTTAMTALAINRLLDRTKPRPNEEALRFPFDGLERELKSQLIETEAKAFEVLFGEGGILEAGSVTTQSKTFGKNDVLTLSYLLDLARVQRDSDSYTAAALRKYASDQCAKLKKIQPKSEYEKYFEFTYESYRQVMANAFIQLRAIQTVRQAETLLQVPAIQRDDLSQYRLYFEEVLHIQLSYSAIPDSRFDPAELAFCLEGLLLTQSEAVDRSTMSRVMEVLRRAQTENAYWRPIKPILANERGEVLFPVSVEVANSLMRSCELFDRKRLYDTFASSCIDLFRRYWLWLRARRVRLRTEVEAPGTTTRRTFVGWHSEHVNEPDVLHIWETSQVLEFLLSYRRLLKGHIARTTLIESRFSLHDPDRKDRRKRSWDTICYDYEPVTSMGDQYKVYERIGREFIEGWKDGRPRNYSMLLYGPPGTGKTTLAENIADALNFRLITITVSDFLANGGTMLEANAKAIFDVLNSQADCVVLFDEIDSFLLDRDSPRHSQQETIFQFMTPGMLTKLNDLRRIKRVIFVIATNYESRIDPAIKRTGRIDHTYLVLPSDAAARKRILTKLIEQEWNVLVKDRDADLPQEQSTSSPVFEIGANWQRLLKSSLFLGYKDMAGSVKEARANDLEDLIDKLQCRVPTTRLAPYLYRFRDEEERVKPEREFLALVRSALEVDVREDLLDQDNNPTELAKVADKAIEKRHEGNNEAERVIAAARALGGGDECAP